MFTLYTKTDWGEIEGYEGRYVIYICYNRQFGISVDYDMRCFLSNIQSASFQINWNIIALAVDLNELFACEWCQGKGVLSIWTRARSQVRIDCGAWDNTRVANIWVRRAETTGMASNCHWEAHKSNQNNFIHWIVGFYLLSFILFYYYFFLISNGII